MLKCPTNKALRTIMYKNQRGTEMFKMGHNLPVGGPVRIRWNREMWLKFLQDANLNVYYIQY
jgi:hypothetical protein